MSQPVSSPAAGDPPLVQLVACKACGAVCDLSQPKCWMCDAPLPTALTGNLGAHARPNLLSDPHQSRALDILFKVLLVACLGLATLVGIGIGTQDPGALIGYFVLVGPAFAVTGVRALWQIGESGKTKPGRLLLSLFVSFALTAITIVLLALAAVGFLFLLCFWEMGQL